jgi:hypothetical protein
MSVAWGAIFTWVLMLAAVIVSFVVLAMNVDRYTWATQMVAKGFDSVIAFGRRVLRRASA